MKIVSEKQQRHKNALELIHFICKQLQKLSDSSVMDYFLPPNRPAILHSATEHGVIELVQVCLKYFPDLIWYSSPGDQKLLLHVAIKHQRIKIFNYLIHLIGENAGPYAGAIIEGEDNILHLAARLPPTPQLHSVPGPAFQMQRELQWLKVILD